MSRKNIHRTGGRTALVAGGLLAALAMPGCETDSFFDPSVVGRWEPTPVTMPILTQLDVIDEGRDALLPVTPVRAEDLEPDTSEYTIGAGDYLLVTIFELIVPGQDNIQQRQVDETGRIRLPVVGSIKATGYSPSQLEEEIIATLERKGILRDATVSVNVIQSGQNVYHIIGTPGQGQTRFGTYGIPTPDFRLLQAVALAGGVPDKTQNVLIFRSTPLTAAVAGTAAAGSTTNPDELTPPATDDPEALLDQLLEGGDAAPAPSGNEPQIADRPAPPTGVEAGLDSGTGGAAQWVYVDGKWVPAGQSAVDPQTLDPLPVTPGDELSAVITQRIIEVPYERLLNGDMRYNIVIRPGDIVRVPSQDGGFAYLMGQIARPGTYQVSSGNPVTLKRMIAAAGGLNGLANPRRVDLIRMIGDNQEAAIRLDLKAIFDMTEPDIFVKPDDLINVGTDFWAVPLAVARNGFRFTYGFGFVVDRNFGNDVFGAPEGTNN